MLHDTWLIFRRDIMAALRNPTWVMIGIMQPLLYLFLFGPLLGKVLANALQAVVQSLLIIALAYLAFDLNAPFGGVLLSMVIVFLLAVSLASCSYALALTLKSEETFPALLNAVLIPLLLLSGILLPIVEGKAPPWLYTVSQINPFRHVVDVERNTFKGDFTMDALFTGSVVVLVMAVLSVWWGTRTFQRENA